MAIHEAVLADEGEEVEAEVAEKVPSVEPSEVYEAIYHRTARRILEEGG